MSSTNTLPKNFDQLIATSQVPVLVDFYATWCAPCKIVAPVVKQLAAEHKGRLITVKIDIDKKPAIAQKYGVSAVPTIMLFSGGRPVVTLPGARGYDELAQAIAPHVAGNTQ